MKQRIVSVVGARPQFVKAAVVSAALRDAGHEEVMVHTGQHYDPEMADLFFDELGVRAPDVHMALFAAGFMATDPPTSPPKYHGQWIFGVIAAVGLGAQRQIQGAARPAPDVQSGLEGVVAFETRPRDAAAP